MTQYTRPKERPEGSFYGFHHCELFVTNAKQAADWMCFRFGFKKIAYRGLETGSREYVSHVIQQNKIIFVYTSPLLPKTSEMTDFIAEHGDAVKDVAFYCDDAAGIWKKATSRGAKSVRAPQEIKDKNGVVVTASLQTYGHCIHTLIQKKNYNGVFLPGFEPVDVKEDPLFDKLPSVGLEIIDHCVGNQPDGKMIEVADWYQKMLDFHRFWSVDDSQVHTEYSALRSIVMTDFDRVVKMPLNEPAQGKKKSQIQEYVEYHGGPGVQHIALRTRDIIKAIEALKARGVKFLTIPKEYYDDLRERLKSSPINVDEDLNIIEKLNILVDFDDKGYLLQIFSENVEDRPTLFYEVIQRHNHDGFGAGNFKALFTSIERSQAARGNLTATNEDSSNAKSTTAKKAKL